VDTETEGQIREALDRLIKGRTTIAIAHRFSTLRNADRLMVLEQGKLVESGSHAELLAQPDGLFRRLSEQQQQLSEIVAVGG
jgi:ATP-binding cassette subfamily B protein